MKTKLKCYACFIDDLEGAMELLDLKESVKRDAMHESLQFIAESVREGKERNIPSWFITRIHRILKKRTGNSLLFSELRDTCNRIGKEIASKIREESASLSHEEKLAKYMIYAMAGNHLDFRTVGTGYGIGADHVRNAVEETVAQGLTVDEREEVIRMIGDASTVLLIPDNVGEIAFDSLLAEEIASAGKDVVVPYRGGAITSDAIEEDFQAVGFTDKARLICAGPDTLGIAMDEMSDELEKAIAEADLVITKGQANFYLVHEFAEDLPVPGIASILTTKCIHVSRIMGHEKDRINAVKVVKQNGSFLLDNS